MKCSVHVQKQNRGLQMCIYTPPISHNDNLPNRRTARFSKHIQSVPGAHDAHTHVPLRLSMYSIAFSGSTNTHEPGLKFRHFRGKDIWPSRSNFFFKGMKATWQGSKAVGLNYAGFAFQINTLTFCDLNTEVSQIHLLRQTSARDRIPFKLVHCYTGSVLRRYHSLDAIFRPDFCVPSQLLWGTVCDQAAREPGFRAADRATRWAARTGGSAQCSAAAVPGLPGPRSPGVSRENALTTFKGWRCEYI